MMWWSDPSVRDAVEDAVGAINEGRALLDDVHSCQLYAQALNKLFNARAALLDRDVEQDERSDDRLFRDLVRSIGGDNQEWLLSRPALRELASLEPPIASHIELRRYLLDEVPPEVARRATREHRHFREHLERYERTQSGGAGRRSLDALTRLLWVVRSNIMHGEKSMRGPDVRRLERNREVARRSRRVFDDVGEAVFDRPDRRLLAYGSLRPGEEHAQLLEPLPGIWSSASVRGEVEFHDGYPVLVWTNAGENRPAAVLASDDLPTHWDRLDAFEGARYRRDLVVFEDDSGGTGVANCYVRAPGVERRGPTSGGALQ